MTCSLAGEAKKVFLQEYAEEHISNGELIADTVLSPLVTLYFACKGENFLAWATLTRYNNFV